MKRIGYVSLATAAVFGAAAIGVTAASASGDSPAYPTARIYLTVSPYAHTRIDHPLTLTATVSPTNSSATPTGTINFSTGGASLPPSCSNVPLTKVRKLLKARCSIPNAKLYMDRFEAEYSGDSTYDPVSTTVDDFQVTAASVTTVSMPARSTVGKSIVVVTRTTRAEGRFPIYGTLSLYRNGHRVESVILDDGRVAKVQRHIGDFRTTVIFTHPGTYYFSAQYFGSYFYRPSAGHSTITVTKAG
jgi:hypothetical protein